ncbi:Hpt domain-containing protein [Cellulophaga fucicola]|uniref:HPt (Histidine-containing phosphotransfer) domain-containing protein n=1 Tax=Cellulophaga fucicola TaxID=76595 RepID=A0A1K1R512_9FLAO|nr:Hpt domain-containing protein [Cellulophaga fucicola]SFW67239.1 HPt (histidine-containing phosphotransfer) domain-containing protein [Cellulophaga fucicola]
MIYSLDKLNEMAEGDTEFINSVVSVFLEEVPEDLDLLEKAIESKDYEPTYQLAHKIKPNVDLLGMEQTRAAAFEIETLGKEKGDFVKIEETFKLLKIDVQQVVSELKNDFNL